MAGSGTQSRVVWCRGPLSPLLAAAVMFCWTSSVSLRGVDCIAYVDDRSFWSSNPARLTQAREQSDAFDRVFNFSCSLHKCQLACRVDHPHARDLEARLA